MSGRRVDAASRGEPRAGAPPLLSTPRTSRDRDQVTGRRRRAAPTARAVHGFAVVVARCSRFNACIFREGRETAASLGPCRERYCTRARGGSRDRRPTRGADRGSLPRAISQSTARREACGACGRRGASGGRRRRAGGGARRGHQRDVLASRPMSTVRACSFRGVGSPRPRHEPPSVGPVRNPRARAARCRFSS